MLPALLAGFSGPAAAGTPASGWADTAFATGFSSPTAIAFLPDGRLLVAEKGGFDQGLQNAALKVFDGNTTETLVSIPVCTGSEMGLLGIAVDPDFTNNGFIYLYRTEAGAGGCDTDTGRFNQVVRVTMSDGTVDLNSLTELLSGILTTNGNHDGGGLRIGPDQKLYVAAGDSGIGDNQGGPGSATNPYAQDLSSLNGKILRLNLDGTAPSDNPFFNQAPSRPEIFAYGFRNPWRFGFDPATNELWAGDVGDLTWEEVDIVGAGNDYSWPYCEGTQPTGCAKAGDITPILTYPHGGPGLEGEAVIGGQFAPGGGSPFEQAGLAGDYFFADLGERIGDPSEGTLWHAVPTPAHDGIVGTPEMIVSAAANPVDVVFGPDGALYYIAILTGEIRRVIPDVADTSTSSTSTTTTSTSTTTAVQPTITTSTTTSSTSTTATTSTVDPTTTTPSTSTTVFATTSSTSTTATTSTVDPTTTTSTTTTSTSSSSSTSSSTSSTTTSQSTSTTELPSTSTTLPPDCGTLPPDANVRCTIDQLRTLVNPQLDCALRRGCQCTLAPALTQMLALLDQAQGASSASTCRRKLGVAQQDTASFQHRVNLLVKRNCVTSTDLGHELATLAANLRGRASALQKRALCVRK
jgi:glucose/arabinose dehydrogenase